jgi:hypothetical protein
MEMRKINTPRLSKTNSGRAFFLHFTAPGFSFLAALRGTAEQGKHPKLLDEEVAATNKNEMSRIEHQHDKVSQSGFCL